MGEGLVYDVQQFTGDYALPPCGPSLFHVSGKAGRRYRKSARVSDQLRIELSFPARELSPNENPHPMVFRRFKDAAKKEAFWATRIVMPIRWFPAKNPLPIHFIICPKPTGPKPDTDNFIANCKYHIDGISEALSVNDRDFDAPTVEWADRCQYGKLVVVVG